MRGGDAVVSWIGSSRAYWLAGDGSSRLLSTDDSWAEEIANAGLMSREDAARDRRAHVLTRWLGRDAPGGPAHARRVRLGVPGLLMLCSDGLWNHLPDPDVLARLAAPALGGSTPGTGDDDPDGEHVHPALARDGAAVRGARRRRPRRRDARDRADPPPADSGRPSVSVDGRGPDERTGPIPLDGKGVVDR